MCVFTCIALAIVWFFVGSYLLFLTWNKVVSQITKLNAMKYWQALLVIVTLLVLCAPKYAYKMHHRMGYMRGADCPLAKTTDCPFHNKKGMMK